MNVKPRIVRGMTDEEYELRLLLATQLCSNLTVNDYELQDLNELPFIDYLRDSPKEIHDALDEREALRRYQDAQDEKFRAKQKRLADARYPVVHPLALIMLIVVLGLVGLWFFLPHSRG